LTTPFASTSALAVPFAKAMIASHDVIPLDRGWEVASTDPDERSTPAALDGLGWLPAQVPGTAAGAMGAAGLEAGAIDSRDWWFRTTFDAKPAGPGEELVLRVDGLATVAEVYLNGEQILASDSMFASHEVDIGARLKEQNELVICCRALGPLLAAQRRPRARWRTRLVPDNSLRWFRTMLLGRIPSFSPGPAAAGPWRPVVLERRRDLVVETLALRPRIGGDDGVLEVKAHLRDLGSGIVDGAEVEISGPSGDGRAALRISRGEAGVTVEGELRIPRVARWWPHTHGTPALHDVRLVVSTAAGPVTIDAGRVGFRTLAPGATPAADIDRDGLSLHVNGVPVFARGALWTPLDIVGLGASRAELRAAIEQAAAAGMNMLRLPGFGPYEQETFHELCDELGMLVWQDLMFASMDYPFDDPGFGKLAEAEVGRLAARLAGRPSTAVLCGNSEIEQQVAMLGLDMGLARIPFFDTVAPGIARAAGLDAVYVPSAPFGGDLPMRADRGVTNYYGVGGYRAPLSDARTSGVRFASECLAFANVPDDEALATLVPEPPGEAFVHHPRWKAGVARDAGAGWDFDDLRDHYLRLVFEVDPGTLRRGNPDRYLELSRAVTGEVMAAVFGEWRRAGSPCAGGLILWLRDLVAGAGYGVVDNHGRPKDAYFHLRRALAPTAVWLTDEWTGGVVAHIANDGPVPLSARLRVALYSDQEMLVDSGEVPLELSPHGYQRHDIETVVGHFVDAAWAYRFGPPAQDAIVVSLERDETDGRALLSQAFHFPAGRPRNQEPERRLGLAAAAIGNDDGSVDVTVSSRRLAYGVRLDVPGFSSSDNGFSVEPGGSREVTLRPGTPGQAFRGSLTALNLSGRVAIRRSVEVPVDVSVDRN
jgi:beta-mannosidase